MHNTADEEPQSRSLREVKFDYTPTLPAILTHLRASILVTTYQAGKLLVLGAKDGKLQISFLDYDQPMGLAVSKDRIAIGTRKQIHFLVPAHETQQNRNEYDGCFVPRSSFYTGSIHGHDLGWGHEGLWIVNTLFSSLATLHEDFSFVPQWRPKFISELIDQDRCHLNGMAMLDGRPKFVTAMSQTDTAAGWRANKASSGVIMEVPSGRVVCQQLSMPHSPRLYSDRLWVLNSGHGSFGYVEPSSGTYQTVEQLPGYTRGLSFCGQFAFVGLSKIRETAIFGGVPIAERRDELRCGVGVIDLTSGRTVATFQFLSGVTEIFAVEALAGFSNPLIAGASVDLQEREVWVVPHDSAARPRNEPRMPIFAAARTDSNQLPDANDSLELAIAKSPDPVALLVDLGNLRQDQGNQQAARLCYERALELEPNFTVALQNLGYLLFNLGETEKAHDVYERLLAIAPTPLNRLLAASVLPVVYDSQADIDFWRNRQLRILKDLAASGEQVDATESLVPTCFFAAYQGRCNVEVMKLRASGVRGKDFTLAAQTLAAQPRKPGERLRVGFMSAYYREHTIGRLNIARLENLSREHIELTIVFAGSGNDSLTQRFEKAADHFVQLPRQLPQAIETLSAQRLDILVHADVGMDSLTQSLAYSRFAPVQVATWGHPDTTGSLNMDYFLSSEGLEPDDSQSQYTEKLLKLATLGIDYERPEHLQSKTRVELGLPPDKHLYICPQTLFKFHPDFDAILAGILEQDPNGELILLEGRLPEWTHRLQRRFRRTLPEAGRRVRFLPALPREDFLSLIASADVLLDPIHFGGGNSSLEALSVGVPLISMEGRFLRSRISSTLYKQVGLDDLIASDSANYVRLAVQVACDPSFNRTIRDRLRTGADRFFSHSTAAKELEACLLSIDPRKQ